MRTLVITAWSLALLIGCTSLESADKVTENYAGAAELETFCDRLPRAAYAGLRKHEASTDWFEVYEIKPKIFAIYEPFQWQEVISYLIIGESDAVMFDTGNGIGDIGSVVDELTDKPIQVINSHSHIDHVGGNYQFDNILSLSTPFGRLRSKGLNNADVAEEVSDAALCKPLPNGTTATTHFGRPFTVSRTIKDGDIIDIGGRRLEIVHIPGHTDDAMALLDREAGFLWSGDSYYEGPIWLFAPETDLAAYRKSVNRLAALAPNLNTVFPAHNTPTSDPNNLIELAQKLELVLAGKLNPDSRTDGQVEFKFENFSLLFREDLLP